MQAQILPISTASASLAPASANLAPASARGPAAADASAEASTPFAEALSREIGQRQQAADAPAADVPELDPGIGLPAVPDEPAIATEETAITPVTDMLALVASLAPPAPPTPAPKLGTDPNFSVAPKLGTDPNISVATKLGSVPNFADDSEPASPASAMFAQAFTQAVQAPGMRAVQDGAGQLRSMFATASALPAQAAAPAIAATGEAASLAPELVAGVVAQPVQGRAAAQPAAAPQADVQKDLVALGAADGQAAVEPVALESAPATSFATQLQAARSEQVPANPMLAGDRLPARVGTTAWDKQLGQKIVFMAAGAEQSASLILNPPDLGPVQVVLNITNDQATVQFSSAQLEVRQALENAMPKLREMMGESGITLGNATVNAGMPEQQQQAQRGQDARARGNSGNGRGTGASGAGGDDAAPAVQVRRVAVGAVDTFA